MSIEEKSDGRTVQLKRVRLSFATSLKDMKKTANTDDAKMAHSANLILEAGSETFDANKAKCMAAIKEACSQEWKKEDKWKDIQEDNPKRICFRKGERFKNQQTGLVYAGYEGNMVIAGKGPGAGQRRPKLLDRRKRLVEYKDILDVCYGGSLVDAVVSFYGTQKGGDGVFCSIEAIRSWEEGDRVGGGIEVDEDDFEDLDDLDEAGASGSAASDDDDIG